MIFDLWDTLVEWPAEAWRALEPRVAAVVGLELEDFRCRWVEVSGIRYVGPLCDALEAIGVSDSDAIAEVTRLRREHTQTALRPREGAVETIAELRRRGLKVGLITVCSEEVPALWHETPFAELFDATVFSCSVGLTKPDARIYRLAADELGVEPAACLFVGDGANDELAGAVRAGMQAALVLRPDEDEPVWEEARGWQPRITSIPEVLELC